MWHGKIYSSPSFRIHVYRNDAIMKAQDREYVFEIA